MVVLNLNHESIARDERLHKLAEKAGEMAFAEEECAPVVHLKAEGAEEMTVKAFANSSLQGMKAGWGSRTRT